MTEDVQGVCYITVRQLHAVPVFPNLHPNFAYPFRSEVFEEGFGEKLFSKSFFPQT
jgi:hypothetical protein